jgi:hypothetical protein
MRLFAFVLLLGCGGAVATDPCKSLAQKYVTAKSAATVCATPGGDAPNCTVLRPHGSNDPKGSPFLCNNCEQHVEAAAVAQLDDLLRQLNDNSCAGAWQINCPGCVTTDSAVCNFASICE